MHSSIPRAMNFGHSHLEAWNTGFEELSGVYSNVEASAHVGDNGARSDDHPGNLAHPQYQSQRPLHTTQPLQTSAYQSSSQPNSWTPRYDSYDPPLTTQHYTLDGGYSPFAHNAPSYPTQPGAYPTQSSYPPPRLTPPSHHGNQTLSRSLDPSTGIFYRTPEHPRLRTAQACEKCRTRKAKCSGEHPSCKRCLTRGLICRYAPEGRVRGPNKPKKPVASSEGASPPVPKSKFATTPTWVFWFSIDVPHGHGNLIWAVYQHNHDRTSPRHSCYATVPVTQSSAILIPVYEPLFKATAT
ncbi:hypothetical protein EV421DRAFT_1947932 [Armillaria borealis]|uniref:Zn(2)-C6 fungal-type domain-containing protein n=1 Tax=Armillaria borealis TaxID=47425 RepID=A0AA39MQU2_9AGAR|nr:hypothetical protein EV421DRAFT_1947932 [Armillaria borealis]